MTMPTGWFPDVDNEADVHWPWRPYLQVSGACLPLAVSFDTEEACLAWIRENVIGQGELP